MRAFITVVVLLLVAGLVGYERGWFTFSSHANDHRADFNLTVNKDQWQKDRAAFQKQAETRLNDLHRQLEELRARAKTAGESSRTALNKEADDLSRKYQSARDELKEFANSAQASWETQKARLGHALDDLKKGFDNAAERFR